MPRGTHTGFPLQHLTETKEALTVEDLATKTGAAPLLLETGKDTFDVNNITHNLSIPAIQAGVYHKYHSHPSLPPFNTPKSNNSHSFDNCGLPDYLKENLYQNITDPTHTPLQKAFNTTCMEAHHSSKPRWFDVYPMDEKIRTRGPEFEKSLHDPEQVFFVDVGGGIGHYTVQLKKRFPWIKSANFYFLSNIMHDYPDSKCVTILQNIVSAMSPDSTTLINNMVLPNAGTQLDLTMLTMLASLERTVEQWYSLLGRAGLRVKRAWENAEAVTEAGIECISNALDKKEEIIWYQREDLVSAK
ncbi:S-adenosyl-L-methionine-dependent methyltransferase [Aspergillus undulatus]|uniref:S-adenosyl-L-methionine-dependent methyltransferase n=1 Tax=Aspergillus undulatus TaxID=1810928 RepID=UPI003CCCC35C